MFDAMMPLRIAQTATDLAIRNATLAMSFWTGVAPRAMAMWVGQKPEVGPEPARSTRTLRSWYRHPDQPSLPFGMSPFGLPGLNPFAAETRLESLPFSPAAVLQPWLETMAGGAGSCIMPAMSAASPIGMLPWSSPMQAPMLAWMKMWSQAPTGMLAGPMAFALMAFGMPRLAAWPTAEAGAHALEASRKATEGMEQMFSAYRSGGGHAIAQIVFAGPRLH